MVGVVLEPMFAFRDGRLRPAAAAERARSFRVAGRARPAVSIGGAEHFSLPAAYPAAARGQRVPRLGGRPARRPCSSPGAATSLATRVPGVRAALRFGGEQLAAWLPAPAPGTTSGATSWIVAVAHDGAGAPLAEVHLRGGDPYAFTAGFLAWAASRAASAGVAGAGAVGPVEAFGLEALERGCAEAGLERARR